MLSHSHWQAIWINDSNYYRHISLVFIILQPLYITSTRIIALMQVALQQVHQLVYPPLLCQQIPVYQLPFVLISMFLCVPLFLSPPLSLFASSFWAYSSRCIIWHSFASSFLFAFSVSNRCVFLFFCSFQWICVCLSFCNWVLNYYHLLPFAFLCLPLSSLAPVHVCIMFRVIGTPERLNYTRKLNIAHF
jgi:hypothetical protein